MEKQEYNAGYLIKERFVVGNIGVALGYNEAEPSPYVTWNYRREAPMHFFWGHYFSDEQSALQDYEKRINEEVAHYESRTGKPFPIPPMCLSVIPSSGELVNIKRGMSGYCISDWNIPNDKARNREIADMTNEKLGVTKQQEAAMMSSSMFGWHTPAANPKNYDENGRIKKLSQQEQER